MRRGEIRWCTLRKPDKVRPVVILTRSSAIPLLTSVSVAPLTSTMRGGPSQVLLSPDDDGVEHACVVNLDNMQTVEKTEIGALMTTLSPARYPAKSKSRSAILRSGIDSGAQGATEVEQLD